MDKMNNQGKYTLIAVAVVAIVAIFIIARPGGPQSASTGSPAAGTPAANQPGATGAQGSNPSSAGGSGTGTVKPSVPVIHLITPVANDQWKIGQSNPISWDKEANFTGEIQLLDARTKDIVGVVLSETGAHQTSYAWDTRQVSLDRYSPLKKDIAPGTYMLLIKFDGNNLPNLLSQPFTIVQ